LTTAHTTCHAGLLYVDQRVNVWALVENERGFLVVQRRIRSNVNGPYTRLTSPST
jgi:hypothetical protein